MLQNSALITAENKAIDIASPLAPYSSASLGEAMPGTVYCDAYVRLITNPQKQIFVPIIQWIDGTHVTGNNRVIFETCVHLLFLRKRFDEQFKLGDITDFYQNQKRCLHKTKKMKQGDNIRNYHAQLSAVLDSFTTAGPQLRNVLLPIGQNGSMQVDVITCILLVIQDMQEGYQLCGRFGSHKPNIARHCRACNIKYEYLDLPNAQCRFVLAENMARIARSPNETFRAKWSQHRLDNAVDKMPMADPVVRGFLVLRLSKQCMHFRRV